MYAFLSVFLNLFIVFLPLLGAIALVFGVYKLLRRNHVTLRALVAKQMKLQATPLFATIRLDDETLTRILQRQNNINGVSGIGGGLGLLIGGACGWYFHNEIASHFPLSAVPLDFGITFGASAAGASIGSSLSDLLNGTLWRRPRGQSLSPELRRMSLYRPRWIAALGYFTVVASAVTSLLTISGVILPAGAFPPQLPPQQSLWLAILAPVLITILILGQEANLWLSLHYFPWPIEGESGLALRLVATSRYEKGYAAFTPLPFAFPVAYLLIGTSVFINPSFSLWLALLGIIWFFLFAVQGVLGDWREKRFRIRFMEAAQPLIIGG